MSLKITFISFVYGWLIFHHIYINICIYVCAKSLQPCPTVCDPVDYSLPGSSAHGIIQVRILERVAMSSSRGSSWPRDRTHVSCLLCFLLWQAGGSLPLVSPGDIHTHTHTHIHEKVPGIEPESLALQMIVYHLSHQRSHVCVCITSSLSIHLLIDT